MKYIFGIEELKIEMELKKITKDFDGETFVFMEDSSLADIAMALETSSFFSDKKLIIIKNHTSLLDVELGKKMLVYLSSAGQDNEIVVVNSNDKTPANNPMIKFLNNNAKLIKCDRFSEKEIPSIVVQMVEQRGGKISFASATKIASMLPNDLMIISNEISNLLNFDSSITDENIDKILSTYFDDDYFAFSNAIIEGDTKKILNIYKQKMLLEEDVVSLIGQIASALILSFNIHILKMTGKNETEISNALKIHPFRIKKANKLIGSHGVIGIKQLIVRLAILDKNIKQGLIDKNLGFDAFLLNIIK